MAALGLACTLCRAQDSDNDRGLIYFLHRLRTVDDLPEIEDSHTAMSSTWDRTGGNSDGDDFKRIEGDRNILLDVDGPGCIHRIFTGRVNQTIDGTRIRIVLDNSSTSVFDMDVKEFFDPDKGPFPYPLVFHKTYPGTLFPIPFSRHCRVELYNPQRKNWGDYWQVTYSIYPPNTKVESLRWPLNTGEQAELKNVCDDWLSAESKDPPPPAQWTIDKKLSVDPGATARLNVDECGVVREMRIAANPGTPESLLSIRMGITWDDAAAPSVDVPLGYFFGNGDYGFDDKQACFSSMLTGANGKEAYSRFPMPFARNALFEFTNNGIKTVDLEVKLDVLKLETLPANCGKFHATWTQEYVQSPYGEKMRKSGPWDVPCHICLERADGPGKFVGGFLYVHWPYKYWWGEGDWQIWSDEDAWPPSYHGTGSEEYFNSGWCQFDRKAISGYVRCNLPGNVSVYSFHLNDAFSFQKNIRVDVEVWPLVAGPKKLRTIDTPSIWGSTSFWYALTPRDAQSRKDILPTQSWQGQTPQIPVQDDFCFRPGPRSPGQGTFTWAPAPPAPVSGRSEKQLACRPHGVRIRLLPWP